MNHKSAIEGLHELSIRYIIDAWEKNNPVLTENLRNSADFIENLSDENREVAHEFKFLANLNILRNMD